MSSRVVLNRQLTRAKFSPNIVNAEYAVRGAIVQRAIELEHVLKNRKGGKSTSSDLPFDRITFCNIGNPHNLGQKPLTFPREVLALCNNPSWLSEKKYDSLLQHFRSDVKKRAEAYIADLGVTGTGGYSQSPGISIVRNEVAKFIENRDGYPSDPEQIFLTDGASQGVQTALKMLLSEPNDGLMIPIPQYPLYSAGICLNGGKQVNYYLDEENEWGMNVDHLKSVLQEARDAGTNVKGIAIINPGNPTGQCLSYDNMLEIVKFCAAEGLVILADEVYQANIWQPDRLPFHSFKKVVRDMEKASGDDGISENSSTVELLSFHSVSKGFIGECGRRGGYLELTNVSEEAHAELYKLCSVNLCSNIEGQLMVGMMVNPPQNGDDSYEEYEKEKNDILSSLKRRAKILVNAFNEMEGITCEHTHGALYVFPRIRLPKAFIDECTTQGAVPDARYCMELLENTGIVTVPGSGFGQKTGEFHLRATILPNEEQITVVAKQFASFHQSLMSRYQ